MIYLAAALLLETAILALVIYLYVGSEGYRVRANKIILSYNRLLKDYAFVPHLEEDGQKVYQEAIRSLR